MLAEFLHRQPGLLPDDVAALLTHWQTTRRLGRGDFLTPPGKVEQHLWYVDSGVLRLFYPTDDGEVTVGFAYAGTLVTSAPSFIRQKASTFSIQALSACTLTGLPRSALRLLAAQSTGVAGFWITALEQHVAGLIEREIEISTTTPEERYENLLARAPHLFQLVPLKYIASYLRVTAETLSRVRRK